jgi:hypothetical protein
MAPDRIAACFVNARFPLTPFEQGEAMRSARLDLEQLERRDCPTVSSLPPVVSADLSKLTTDLNKAAVDFKAQAPVLTEVIDAATVMADTAKLAADVRDATHASFGGAVVPLISLELDELTLYYDFATGNTAGAQTAAGNELNDLNALGNALAGNNSGLAAAAFSQAFNAFNNANNSLFGIGSGGGGGGGSGIPS